MRCPTCPRDSGRCLGERLTHLCQRADYRAFLASHSPYFAAEPAEHGPATRPEEPIPPLPPDPEGKVRVGLVCPYLIQGGAEAQQLALARLVDPARVRWEGCAVLWEKHVDPVMRAQTAAFMPVTVGPEAARDLARRCDVLVMWAVGGPAGLTRGMERPPSAIEVCHVTAEAPWSRDGYGQTSGVDRWVAVSELALEAIPPAIRASTPCSVIRNCVDPARLEVRRTREAMHALWGVPPRARVAGYLGRLAEEKDPHAMARLVRELPSDWHAVLVGAGCEEPEEHPRLHLVGPDPAAGDVLNAFDVLVVPSKYESFGLTIAEGLEMGVPTVTTPVGIARLRPGLTHPVPVGADGETLARAVLSAWANGPRRGSREWAREHLGPGRFAREWTDLILSLAPPSPERPGLLAMAGSALGAAARFVAGGGRLTPEDLRDSRLAICRDCRLFNEAHTTCGICGCQLKIKVALPAESCPLNPPRWGPA